jgi:O-antigen ligase
VEPFDAARAVRSLAAACLAALPGALTVYLSFNAGGYFAGATAVVVAILAGVIALRMALLRNPFAGFTRPLVVAIALLAFFSLWTLLSAAWSHAPARSLLEFDLVNVYLFALILFGSAARSHRRVRWMVVATWLAMLGVCVVSLATRLRPDLFPIPANLSPNRLAFPLTYWNALGMFAVIALTLAFYLASSARETPLMRVLATATAPIFAVTILLTFSRAALALGGASLVVYALLARPRGLLGAVLAGGPTSAFAVIETYQAPLIANADTSPLAVLEGRHLTTTLVIACLAAGLGRFVLIELDTRLARLRITSSVRANWLILLGFACTAAVLFAIFGFGGTISDQWREFTGGDNPVGASHDVRARIDTFSIGSRLPGWRIAMAEFDRHPLDGRGADTFPIAYDQQRTQSGNALEAHSLYLQAMSELGLVGVVALVATLLVLIGACFTRSRRSGRSLWVALGVVALAWAVHAGVDWDWQMPAVTLPVIALAACSLSRRERGYRLGQRTELALRVLVGALAIGALITAVRIAASDRDLNASIHAFTGGNCQTAVRDANASIAALASRPQPYAIVGYCEVVSGAPGAGVAALQAAATRDPQNWRYQYGLAVARAAAGQDPSKPLARAERLNPYEPMVQDAAVRLAGQTARSWQLGAAGLPMPVSLQE